MLTYLKFARFMRSLPPARKEQNTGNRFSAIFANGGFLDFQHVEAMASAESSDIGFRVGISQRRRQMKAIALACILDGESEVAARHSKPFRDRENAFEIAKIHQHVGCGDQIGASRREPWV